MTIKGFSVSFETYTRESVADGDAATRGWVVQGVRLRKAVDELMALDALDTIEADCYPINREHAPRWFTATQGSDRYLYAESDDDEGESRSLHIPDGVTPASRIRIARLLGAHGA